MAISGTLPLTMTMKGPEQAVFVPEPVGRQAATTPEQAVEMLAAFNLDAFGLAFGVKRLPSEPDSSFRDTLRNLVWARDGVRPVPPWNQPGGVTAPAATAEPADTRTPFPSIRLGGPPMERRDVIAMLSEQRGEQ